jgi:hypothetical protein
VATIASEAAAAAAGAGFKAAYAAGAAAEAALAAAEATANAEAEAKAEAEAEAEAARVEEEAKAAAVTEAKAASLQLKRRFDELSVRFSDLANEQAVAEQKLLVAKAEGERVRAERDAAIKSTTRAYKDIVKAKKVLDRQVAATNTKLAAQQLRRDAKAVAGAAAVSPADLAAEITAVRAEAAALEESTAASCREREQLHEALRRHQRAGVDDD